jgi:F-type H+-transporting ATPase subunit epsilon
VTPAASVFDDDVSYVVFPAWDGQRGIMHGASPLLTRLGIGPARIDPAEGEPRWFLVDRGFAQMNENVLMIITERAIRAEDLTADQAEEELRDANARAVVGGEDREAVEADQARARVKLAMIAHR